MKQSDVLTLALKIADEYEYVLPKIIFNNKLTTTTGKCFENGPIHLNTKFCEHNNEIIIEGLIKHELAHLKYFDHGLKWQAEVRRMNIIPLFSDAKMKLMVGDGVWTCESNYPYQYACPKGHITRRKTQLTEEVSCGSCSLRFNKKYLLKEITS